MWGPIAQRDPVVPAAEPRLRPVRSESGAPPSPPPSTRAERRPTTPVAAGPGAQVPDRDDRGRGSAAAFGGWAGGSTPGRAARSDHDLVDRGPAPMPPVPPMLPAPVAPVSKDALADLARRLTVAPERIPVPTDDPPADRTTGPTHDLPAHLSGDLADEEPGEVPFDAEPDPGAVGCAVVVDLARDGRRFAGLRAATVVREVAELVAEHLPQGSRLRFDEAHVLALVLPGMGRPGGHPLDVSHPAPAPRRVLRQRGHPRRPAARHRARRRRARRCPAAAPGRRRPYRGRRSARRRPRPLGVPRGRSGRTADVHSATSTKLTSTQPRRSTGSTGPAIATGPTARQRAARTGRSGRHRAGRAAHRRAPGTRRGTHGATTVPIGPGAFHPGRRGRARPRRPVGRCIGRIPLDLTSS